MTTSPALLFRMLMISLALGGGLGIWDDFLFFCERLSALHAPVSRFARGVGLAFGVVRDVVFCLLAAGGVFVICFTYNSGAMRGFAVLALAIGVFSYRLLFGRVIRKLLARLAVFLRHTAYRIWCAVKKPIVVFCCFAMRILLLPIIKLAHGITEKRVSHYDTSCKEKLRETAKKGFITIE